MDVIDSDSNVYNSVGKLIGTWSKESVWDWEVFQVNITEPDEHRKFNLLSHADYDYAPYIFPSLYLYNEVAKQDIISSLEATAGVMEVHP